MPQEIKLNLMLFLKMILGILFAIMSADKKGIRNCDNVQRTTAFVVEELPDAKHGGKGRVVTCEYEAFFGKCLCSK